MVDTYTPENDLDLTDDLTSSDDGYTPENDLDLTADLSSTTYFISGVVERAGSGVEGVKVLLINQGDNALEATATTDASGSYTFDNLRNGTFHVAVQYRDGNAEYNSISKPYVSPVQSQ